MNAKEQLEEMKKVKTFTEIRKGYKYPKTKNKKIREAQIKIQVWETIKEMFYAGVLSEVEIPENKQEEFLRIFFSIESIGDAKTFTEMTWRIQSKLQEQQEIIFQQLGYEKVE
jgi:hypothetical protein